MRTDRYTVKNRKKKGRTFLRVLVLLILVLVASISGLIYHMYKSVNDSLDVSFIEDNPSYEIGEVISATSCIESSEGDLTYDIESLDTGTIGEKEVPFTVSKSLLGGLLKPSKDFIMRYTVEDNSPPVMLWSGEGAVIKKGENFDIKSVIGYGDNADPVPAVSYEGNVDTNTVGDYPLHVTVTDESGNSIDWEMSVSVAEIIPAYSDSSEHIDFNEFCRSNAGNGRHFGIDVSTWQGDIDFESVKNAGCEFVIIRIGYSHDGDVTMDDKFRQNIENARRAGLNIGLYLYSYDNSEDKVRASARWIIEQLDGAPLDLPIAFDWEDFGRFQTYEMSFIDLNRLYDVFSEEIEKAGYKCMLYGSRNYLDKIWADTDTRPVWLAHYTDQTDYASPYLIWQASSSGRIDGIAGAVDMDILYAS